MTTGRKRILVVDDEFSIVETLREILAFEGYDVMAASDGVAGLHTFASFAPEIVLSDQMMPGMSGIQMVDEIRAMERGPDVAIVLMSAAPIRLPAGSTPRWNAVLRKPFDLSALLRAIDTALADVASSR